MFDTSEVCIKLSNTVTSKPLNKSMEKKKMLLYSTDYNDLVGLVFNTLQFISANPYHREWRGVLKNEDSVVISISANIVSIGIGNSEMEASVRLKPIGVLNDIGEDIDVLIEFLHWKVPVCCPESSDYTN